MKKRIGHISLIAKKCHIVIKNRNVWAVNKQNDLLISDSHIIPQKCSRLPTASSTVSSTEPGSKMGACFRLSFHGPDQINIRVA